MAQDLFPQFIAHPDIAQRPRNGKGEFLAWCPWHEDRPGGNPNLHINPEKRIVKCFACNNGGIKALAEAWGLSTKPALALEQGRAIDKTYDYRSAEGAQLFQVVRFLVPPGADKQIRQRRPDPGEADGWAWNLKGVQTVLYHLPELRSAEPEQVVWIVEGEKDADRLAEQGLLATTNPMGANKWQKRYNQELRGRQVAVIPDNDEPGHRHVQTVATQLSGARATVRIIDLGVDKKGYDVSDWLNDAHTVQELQELLAQTPPFEPPEEDEGPEDEGRKGWDPGKWLDPARALTEELRGQGYFVHAGDDAYFFDREQRRLVFLDKDERDLRILLGGPRYQVNRQDPLYPYLVEHLLLEAYTKGETAEVRKFSCYDEATDTVFLDMGAGRVLRISADAIDVRDNGQDGVLFIPMPGQESWEYNPGAANRLLFNTLVNAANFTQEGSELSVAEQRTLFFLWMLSLAWDSYMPTKVLVMAIGPGESGKTSLIRGAGRILIGNDFDVDALNQSEKGEDAFWVNSQHAFFTAYDNVDQNVRWLPDALAQVATGVRISRRQLHTTSTLARAKVSCNVALTSRQATKALRREDVAGRTLIFHMTTLAEKRAEFDLQGEIRTQRSDLMSDYAKMVQRALTFPIDQVKIADPGMRMADFARVATRIGHGLSAEVGVITQSLMSKLSRAQRRFATEADELTELLGIWVSRKEPRQDNSMYEPESNAGRVVATQALFAELSALAKESGIKFTPETSSSLGIRLRNMQSALEQEFNIKRGKNMRAKTWTFWPLDEDPEPEE